MAIAVEKRRAAVRAYEKGEGTIDEVAQRFRVGSSTLARWLQRSRSGEDLAPRRRVGGGYPPVLDDSERQLLRRLVDGEPQSTLVELQAKIVDATGKSPSTQTLLRYLHQMGLRRRRPVVSDRTATPTSPRKDGYRDEHRPSPEKDYPSSVTDAEWEVLRPIFERDAPRGRPVEHTRRDIFDAIFYVVRSGCSWRMLPREFPPWNLVYVTFRRWAAAGLFEQMHDELRRMWRKREGRTEEPSAGIVDSQSVKSTEKGGPGVLMGAKK